MDYFLLYAINDFAGRSTTLDWFMRLVSGNAILKGLPVIMLFLFLWFRAGPDLEARRRKLLSLIAVAIMAIFVGRGMALLLPFRERPLRNPDLDLERPVSIVSGFAEGWSSFPSDHAVLFFAIAACFWLVNRWAGVLAILHALFVVSLVRVYLTLHYPSDILGGALVGIAVALLAMRPLTLLMERAGLPALGERRPEFLYPVLFFFLFQIATMFSSARELADAFVDLVT